MVKTGLEVFINDPAFLNNKRVGLITNPTGINANFQSTIDLFFELTNCRLAALYSLEHGLRGAEQAGEKIETYIDKKTNVPVYSLYGKTEKPTEEMVKEIDVFVYDIQDVGVRFYTYISNLAYAMQAAKTFEKEFVVLDRPNPITGKIEGGILEEEFTSFVGAYPIPIRYGLTAGELALYYNEFFNIGCKLQIIKMEGWKRGTWYDQTGLPWIAPSPNLPVIESTILYPGTCLLEGTNLSEGRGTTKPFEVFGAPWIDHELVAKELNLLSLEGVKFRPTFFKPVFSKYSNDLVHGVQVHITDREQLNAVRVGTEIINMVKKIYPLELEWIQYDTRFIIDRLTGSSNFRKSIEDGSLMELQASWNKEIDRYKESIKPYLLY